MKQGQLLLDLLGSGEHGRWLVIHGHKHHPKISYAAGGGGSAVVFAAGSLCATLYPELQTVARNQFYLIEIDPDECKKRGLVGTVRAWDWASGIGWIDGNDTSGLPPTFGFGARADPTLLAQQIASAITGSDPVLWASLMEQLPEIRYVLPQDLARVQKELSENHGIQVSRKGAVTYEIGRSI
jgi:hypothetical protein